MNVTFPVCISTSWEYTKSTRPYQAFEALANKIMNFVYPENELTKQRSFKFIPNFVVNALGYMTYHSACPFYQTLKAESDPELVKDVNEVFNTLVAKVKEKCPSTKSMSWEIRVKKDSTVNAFCYSGGKVAITTGILTMMKGKEADGIQRKDLIAAVLGHEIVHAVAEHSVKRMQIFIFSDLMIKCAAYGLSVLFVRKPNVDKTLIRKKRKEAEKAAIKKLAENRNIFCKTVENICAIPAFFLRTSHSQSHEFEADRLGMEIAHEANYNVKASVSLQQMFLSMKGNSEHEQKWWFQKARDAISSHPPSQERLRKNRKTANELRGVQLPQHF